MANKNNVFDSLSEFDFSSIIGNKPATDAVKGDSPNSNYIENIQKKQQQEDAASSQSLMHTEQLKKAVQQFKDSHLPNFVAQKCDGVNNELLSLFSGAVFKPYCELFSLLGATKAQKKGVKGSLKMFAKQNPTRINYDIFWDLVQRGSCFTNDSTLSTEYPLVFYKSVDTECLMITNSHIYFNSTLGNWCVSLQGSSFTYNDDGEESFNIPFLYNSIDKRSYKIGWCTEKDKTRKYCDVINNLLRCAETGGDFRLSFNSYYVQFNFCNIAVVDGYVYSYAEGNIESEQGEKQFFLGNPYGIEFFSNGDVELNGTHFYLLSNAKKQGDYIVVQLATNTETDSGFTSFRTIQGKQREAVYEAYTKRVSGKPAVIFPARKPN